MGRKLTQEEFESRSEEIHSNLDGTPKYNYEGVVYTNGITKVKIKCNTCGNSWLQKPEVHLQGHGCSPCSYKQNGENKINEAKDKFIREAEKTHPTKYLYHLVDYKTALSTISLVCKKHGLFESKPNWILNGNGCRKCGREDIKQRKLPERSEEFYRKCEKIHSDTYSYEESVYVDSHTKIKIFCNKCNSSFLQAPNEHANAGQGCPSCAEYGFNPDEQATLYYLSINDGEAYKIGITNRTVKDRFSNTDLEKIKIVSEWSFDIGAEAKSFESCILSVYKEFKYTGEAILSSGNSELFTKDILGLDK